MEAAPKITQPRDWDVILIGGAAVVLARPWDTLFERALDVIR